MRELFNNILSNYIDAKNDGFKGHSIANYIRKDAKDILQVRANIDVSKYKIEGSPGKGRWADIPWISVFDNDITNTATEGYYIVYLFCGDMSGVYISLNQGWTYFKEKYGVKKGKEKIKTVSTGWKAVLSSTLTDFSYDPIQLKGISKNSDLAEGYELGHICGKFYKAGDIPTNDELVEDLRNLMGVYRELKGKLKEGSVEKTNNYLIVNNDLGLLSDDKEDNSLSYIEDTIENISKVSQLIECKQPQNITDDEDKPIEFIPRKINFLYKAKNQKKLGHAGELMVLRYEKEKLISSGKKSLANKVKHVSKDEGDGAGYDILSFDVNGNKKYIEVKTTTGPDTAPFMITHKELEFAKLNSDNYYLYRIFDFDKENGAGKFFIVTGDISKKLKLKPQQYVINGIIENKSDKIN